MPPSWSTRVPNEPASSTQVPSMVTPSRSASASRAPVGGPVVRARPNASEPALGTSTMTCGGTRTIEPTLLLVSEASRALARVPPASGVRTCMRSVRCVRPCGSTSLPVSVSRFASTVATAAAPSSARTSSTATSRR